MFLIPFYAILRQSLNYFFCELFISLLFSALFPTIHSWWRRGLYPSNTPPAGSRCESHHTQGISIVLLRITFLPLGITYADEPCIVLFIVHLNHPRLNTGKPDIFKIEFYLLRNIQTETFYLGCCFRMGGFLMRSRNKSKEVFTSNISTEMMMWL